MKRIIHFFVMVSIGSGWSGEVEGEGGFGPGDSGRGWGDDEGTPAARIRFMLVKI